MADDFERAVLILLNPPLHPPEAHAQANQITASILSAPTAHSFLLERLKPSTRPEISFWILQQLHGSLQSPSPPASASRAHILDYARAISTTHASSAPPAYLKNKLAQVVVAHIASDYPSSWPSAMRETVLPLAGDPSTRTPATLDLFFRIMRTLDAEVTCIVAAQSSAIAREISVRVKDAIRDDCAQQFVQLLAALAAVPAYADHAYDLVARNVEWLDISMFTNDAFLPGIYAAVTSSGPAATRASAAYALRAIVEKRMAIPAKLALLLHLQVLQLLAAFPASIPTSEEDESVGGGVAEKLSTADLPLQGGRHESAVLINSIAAVALDTLRALIPGSSAAKKEPQPPADLAAALEASCAIAEAALPLALRFVGADMDEAVSQEALKCVTAYINVFGRLNAASLSPKNGGANPANAPSSKKTAQTVQGAVAASEDTWTRGREGLVKTLNVIEERACFPAGYDPRDDDDPFHELRKVLLNNVVRGITRANPSVVLAFLRRIAAHPATATSVPRTELVLTLLGVMAEVSLDIPGLSESLMSAVSNPPPPTAITPGMGTAEAHQLDAMQIAHLELVSRAYRLVLLAKDPSVLALALAPFFDSRGLQNQSSPAVRARAAHLLLKLTRPLRGGITSHHLQPVMGAIQPMMFPVLSSSSGQSFQDQMAVYEIAGILLGTDSERPDSISYLGALLGEIVNALKSSTAADQLIAIVSAAGQLSKGFAGDSSSSGTSPPGSPDDSKPGKKSNGQQPNSRQGSSDTYISAAAEMKMQKPKPISEQSLSMWRACLEAILVQVGLMGPECAVLSSPPVGMDTELRSKTVFILHRMVETMGIAVVPYLGAVLQLLLTSSTTPAELRSVVVLSSQAVAKFGPSFGFVLRSVFAEIVNRVRQYPVTIDPSTMLAMSEEGREVVELDKAFYYLIHALFVADCTKAMVSEQNVMLVPVIVSTHMEAIIGRNLDLRAASTVVKMALSTLSRMVGVWVTPFGSDAPADVGVITGFGGDTNCGFVQYIVEVVAPGLVRSCVEGTLFRSGDFATSSVTSVIGESVALQRACALRIGTQFGESLQNRGFACLLPARQQDVATYVAGLSDSCTSQQSLVIMFLVLIQAVRAAAAAMGNT